MIKIEDYVDYIPELVFEPVTDKIWNGIQYENLDEEADNFNGVFDRKRWVYAELPTDEEDEEGLREEKDFYLEKFNQFDILLKNTYNMKYIDLIDYETGLVYIVTYK